MIRLFCFLLCLTLPASFLFTQSEDHKKGEECLAKLEESNKQPQWKILYHNMKLDSMVSEKAFQQAVAGFYKIKNRKKDILTLIDFSKASTEERLFVLDMKAHKVLFSSVVSHGRNSGGNFATYFSNKNGSYKSSLGFYLTNETYQGSNGYSLRLDGLEKGVNDNARQRAIVMHGAAYAHPSTARNGRLGRSLGCPAIPPALTRPIIDTIKGGSVMFIYAPQEEYIAHSTILNEPEENTAFSEFNSL